MKITEIVILICGILLFLFSIVMMLLLFKKGKSFIKIIWFIVISFLMMGFSVINEADVVGIFKYKKQQELSELSILTEALTECPNNKVLKNELERKLTIYIEREDKLKKPEVIEKIGNAYLALGNEDKAISVSEKVLSSDTTNQSAKTLKKAAIIQNSIKRLSERKDVKELTLEIEKSLRVLEKDSNVNPRQIARLKILYEMQVKNLVAKDSSDIKNDINLE